MSIYSREVKYIRDAIKSQEHCLEKIKKIQKLLNQIEWEIESSCYSTTIYTSTISITLTIHVEKMSEQEILDFVISIRNILIHNGFYTMNNLRRREGWDTSLAYSQKYTNTDDEKIDIEIVSHDSPDCEVIEVEETVVKKKLKCKEE